MTTTEKIIQYIQKNDQASGSELARYLDISDRAVRKQLKTLLDRQIIIKIGTPPKVFYKISNKSVTGEIRPYSISKKSKDIVEKNFLYITPLGEYIEGISGFLKWCSERNLDIKLQAEQYIKILSEVAKTKKNGVIIATEKLRSSFDIIYLNEVFYLDFYSIPQFSKTKLGQLLLYAKQSQDKQRIGMISSAVKPLILKVIANYKIDAVGFIPATIKREVQFMRELERNLNLTLPLIKISKIKTEIIVPQKTLSKMADRILNAKNTIIVEDRRKFNNILLIDDAVGSGATLNETAKKIIESGLANNVFGLAITGSYKGFDVISEV